MKLTNAQKWVVRRYENSMHCGDHYAESQWLFDALYRGAIAKRIKMFKHDKEGTYRFEFKDGSAIITKEDEFERVYWHYGWDRGECEGKYSHRFYALWSIKY